MASNTSCKCRELGVVTSTASTSAERQRSSVESNARGILYCRADSWALCRSRRESAVTRQFFASEKPGMSRRTACNPKPTIPNRIIFVRIWFALCSSNHSGRLPLESLMVPVLYVVPHEIERKSWKPQAALFWQISGPGPVGLLCRHYPNQRLEDFESLRATQFWFG